jgi:hypothetical protein
MASKICEGVIGMQDIQPWDEFISDLGNEHLGMQRVLPTITSIIAFFKAKKVSPDIICRMCS